LILVADQDPHIERLERYFLENAGFDVEFVQDGETGLARARTDRPAIVITELLLAKKDGLSVCRALKEDPATRDIRVLVFSVLAAEARARQAGADAFLRKPLDDARLIATVQSLLAQRIPGA
jgi:DNA-binding response OmpR family regulator